LRLERPRRAHPDHDPARLRVPLNADACLRRRRSAPDRCRGTRPRWSGRAAIRTPGETLLRSAVDRSKRAGGHPTFAPDCRATPEPAGLVIANNDLERLAEAGGQLGRVVRSEHGRLARLSGEMA